MKSRKSSERGKNELGKQCVMEVKGEGYFKKEGEVVVLIVVKRLRRMRIEKRLLSL